MTRSFRVQVRTNLRAKPAGPKAWRLRGRPSRVVGRARQVRLKQMASFLLGSFYAAAVIVLCYVLLAYAVLPWMWTHHEQQKGLQARPMVTRTGQGITGDPINVGLVGSQHEIVRAISVAGWLPADPVTLR